MANITVRYRDPLKELTKTAEEQLSLSTVKDLLAHIKKAHGKDAAAKAKMMLIAIDGDSIQLRDGYSTQLRDGETVQFLPICGGG